MMSVVDLESRLEILKNLGLSSWILRNDFLFLDKPFAFARLAIVLAQPLKQQDLAAKKVLMGMLSVLELKKEEYWLGWLEKTNKSWTQDLFWQSIQTWSPAAILLLGQDLVEKLGLLSLIFNRDGNQDGQDSRNDRSSQSSNYNRGNQDSNYNQLEGNNNQDDKKGSNTFNLPLKIYATFHPEELIKIPENKKKAYQSLLNLKRTLLN